MAYAAATSPGVSPSRRISPHSTGRIVFRGLAFGIGAVAVVSVVGGCVIIAAGWMVAASVNARTGLRTTGPFASPAVALADRRHSPLRAAGYLSMAKISPDSVSVPNFNLDVKPAPMPIAASFPMGRLAMTTSELPEITNSIPPARTSELDIHRDSRPVSAAVAKPAIPDVPLPRTRPQLALSIEPKRALERVPVDPIPSRTAIYDIEARTVYMPNGDKLEAHSGLGEWMDDPGSVKLKNRGVTPPNTYQLTLRESSFHGVQAIRLNPVDDDKMFGRDGILAHSYMLGPSGQSNGCVSFRDYQQFLQAFQRGEVDRIVVVTNSGREPVRAAARSPARHADRYRYALNSRRPNDIREDYAAVH